MKYRAVDWLVVLNKSPVYRIVKTQFIATILVSGLCLVVDQVAAVSALMAGIVCVVPGCYLVLMSIRPVVHGDTGLGNAIRGQVGKLVLMACLFSLVFVFVKPLNVIAFFATLVGLQLCTGLVPFFEARKLRRVS